MNDIHVTFCRLHVSEPGENLCKFNHAFFLFYKGEKEYLQCKPFNALMRALAYVELRNIVVMILFFAVFFEIMDIQHRHINFLKRKLIF